MSATVRSATHPGWIVFRKFSLVALAAGCVVLACLFILAIQLSTIWRAREVRLHEAGDAAANVSQAVAQHAYDTLKEVDTLLLGLVERGDILGPSDIDRSRMQALLRSRVAELPQLQAIVVFADDGRALISSGTGMPVHFDSADNEYLGHHRQQNDLQPYIGMGVGNQANGDWIMAVSRRINLPDGRFGGVVLATLRLDYFRKFYEEFSIGEQGAILMQSAAGRIVLKRPFDGDLPEIETRPSTFFSEALAAVKLKETRASQGQDGKSRIISYRKITDYPLVVLTALSQDEALRALA